MISLEMYAETMILYNDHTVKIMVPKVVASVDFLVQLSSSSVDKTSVVFFFIGFLTGFPNFMLKKNGLFVSRSQQTTITTSFPVYNYIDSY